MRALVLFAASLSCFGAARTASVTGNWNDTATWGGSAAPGNGDTVTINSGITVTVTASATVGTSPADCSAVAIQNNSGTLTINTTIVLTVRGCTVLAGTGVLNVNGTGVFEMDASAASSPSMTHYTLQISAAHFDTARLNCTGTNFSNMAKIRSNAGGGTGAITDGGFLGGGALTVNFCRFESLGSSGTNALQTWPAESSSSISITNSQFDTCGQILLSAKHASATATLSGITTTNSTASSYALRLDSSIGAYTITGSVFDNVVAGFTTEGAVLTNNLFEKGISTVGSPWATFSNNMYGETGDNDTASNGNFLNVYAYSLAAETNPHPLHLLGGETIDGFIFEHLNPADTSGDMIIPSDSASVSTIQNSIKLPNPGGNSSASAMTFLGGANTQIAYNKNTVFIGDILGGLYFGETYAGTDDMITSLKSNAFWDTSARGYKLNPLVATMYVMDLVAGANANYNGGSSAQYIAGAAGKGYDNTFTAAPGANDLVADPGFVDSGRGLAKWDASLGGPGTATNALAILKARNSVSADSRYTIAALINYVRQGFAPRNLRYATSGHDGGRMGAVPVNNTLAGVLVGAQ